MIVMIIISSSSSNFTIAVTKTITIGLFTAAGTLGAEPCFIGPADGDHCNHLYMKVRKELQEPVNL